MSKPQSRLQSRLIRGGVATAAVTATAIAASAVPAFAAAVPVTLSSTTGPAGTTANPITTTITASSTTAWLTGVAQPVTTYSIPACQTTNNNTASTVVAPSSTTVGNVVQNGATDTTKISNYKATLLVPNLPLATASSTTTKYNVCIYASSTLNDPLIGTATYTVAAPASIASGTITPASGPALGGSQITVTGTGFPTTAGSITATLGGAPLTNVTPVSATSFTATTPYHASGSVALAVTTPAGTVTKQNAFTYSNGIVISPNTASNATGANPVYVDILGSNFLADNFGTYTPAVAGTNDTATTNSQVYLVNGVFAASTGTTATYASGPIARCAVTAVISDSELICQMNLSNGALAPTTGVLVGSTAVPNGTYTMTVVSNAATNTGATNGPTQPVGGTTPAGVTVTDISSGSTFTVAPY